MRLSPQRLLLRVALLLVAGGLAAMRAVEDGHRAAAPGLEPGQALFHSRVALVEWILAGLALLTALAALISLRRPTRRHLLHLDRDHPGEGAHPGSGQGGASRREPPG